MREALVENVHVTAKLQGVNDEVFRPGRDLHEAGQPQEAAVRVVLKRAERGQRGRAALLGVPPLTGKSQL